MHSHSIDKCKHDHVFLGSQHARNERRTWVVVALTAIMMVCEIMAGWLSGSMALLADGWHMATHAVALGIAGLAYLNPPPEAVIHTKRTSRFGEPSCNRTETSDRRFESIARADRHHRAESARQGDFAST